MQITVSGHQVEITEPLRDYVSEKIGRLQKHIDDVINIKVVLRPEKPAQGRGHHPRARHYPARQRGPDMYVAIDALAAKLDRQMLRHRGKTANHHRGEESLKKLETP
jgi:putative sigma-54 modulation protein